MNDLNAASQRLLKNCILFSALICSACGGGYLSKSKEAHRSFFAGSYIDSANQLEKQAHTEGKDQLLYLLDRATALFYGENYSESIKDFLLADKMSEISDYTSISKEAATLLTSDEIKHYRAEEFEYVLISQYLALAYLFERKPEDALVECRRVNHKLHMLVSQGGRKYKQNPMAIYLSAVLYEDQKEYEDAYIDYQNVEELAPELPFLKADLIRLALLSKNKQDLDRWKEKFGMTEEQVQNIKKNLKKPELVFIVSSGQAPEKKPDPNWASIPKFYSRIGQGGILKLKIKNSNQEIINISEAESRSIQLFDVEKIAMQNLDEKWGPLILKKMAGIIAKDIVADQVGKRTDPLIGALLWMGLHASDTADTRSWLTLPHDFQILRVRLPDYGSYTLDWGRGEKKIIFPSDGSVTRTFFNIKI